MVKPSFRTLHVLNRSFSVGTKTQEIQFWSCYHDCKLIWPEYKPITDCQVTACRIAASWTHGAQRWISSEQNCSGPQQSASLFSLLMSSTVSVRLIREQSDTALQAHSHISRWPIGESEGESERGKERGLVKVKHTEKITRPALLDGAAAEEKQGPEAEHPDSLPCTN